MIPLFALASAAQPLPPMEADWTAPQRFMVEVQVELPQPIWLSMARNRSIRAVGWQIASVLVCQATGRGNARRTQVECQIDDVSLMLGTVLGDRGRAQPVIDEYDELLTDASIRFDVRENGAVARYQISGPPVRNFRTRNRLQNLRMLMRPVLAGLEVQTAPLDTEGDLWLTRESQLCQAPSMAGTLAPIDGVSRGVRRNDAVVEIAMSGRGLMSPGDSTNLMTCEIAARAFFTLGKGIARHTWEMNGDLTPGSPGALGVDPISYTQVGQLVRLTPDEVVELGPSYEFIPEGDFGSALQQGTTDADAL